MNVLKLGLIAIVLFMVSCKVVQEESNNTTGIKSFRIADGSISGWVDQPSGYKEFNPSNMFDLVNGLATFYITGGLVEGIQQTMVSPNGNLNIWVLEMSTITNATQTYTKDKAENIPNAENLGNYDPAVATVNKVILGGCKAYAHFENYIFILSYTGYADKNKSVTDATLFLETFKSKVDKLN
jgi:hypothetical protein